jgi:hypothetical protein
VRVTLPPSGDRWLRRQVATATGGYGRRTRKTLSLRALRFFYPQISRESLNKNRAAGDTNGAMEIF